MMCLNTQVNTAVDPNAENKDVNPTNNNNTINNREYILDDDECPLAILMNHPQSRGKFLFPRRKITLFGIVLFAVRTSVATIRIIFIKILNGNLYHGCRHE